jgi:hypothetical protein
LTAENTTNQEQEVKQLQAMLLELLLLLMIKNVL